MERIGYFWKSYPAKAGFSSTRNIANGGGCRVLKLSASRQGLVTVDNDEARKPALAILQNVVANAKNDKTANNNIDDNFN